MRRLMVPAALALMAGLPGAAQAQTTWNGAKLSITGSRANGCGLRVVEVSHSGSTLNSLRFVISNRATGFVRATFEVTMLGNNQRRMGTVSGLVGGFQQATPTGFQPFGGSLVGSRVVLRVTGCTAS